MIRNMSRPAPAADDVTYPSPAPASVAPSKLSQDIARIPATDVTAAPGTDIAVRNTTSPDVVASTTVTVRDTEPADTPMVTVRDTEPADTSMIIDHDPGEKIIAAAQRIRPESVSVPASPAVKKRNFRVMWAAPYWATNIYVALMVATIIVAAVAFERGYDTLFNAVPAMFIAITVWLVVVVARRSPESFEKEANRRVRAAEKVSR